MNTKWLLGSSAIVMGLAGVAASFMPQELLAAIRVTPSVPLAVMIQLLGALWLFAMMNWMARGSLMGGIYNRPAALGNLLHFTAGGLALAKAASQRSPETKLLIAAAAVYLLFALAFTAVLFGSAVRSSPNAADE